uniref:Ribosomal protein eL8/eL30/eS12/Gadd45 domain-containing protein n=1 Tax=Hyaloperonospora arabidopsidis (strain Emoy2) TaxID=559515 RepID=M4C6Y3_HYAAE
RLAHLQGRAHTQNPRHSRRSRRFVLGMHEVRRGLLCSKIRLLVMAADQDECQVLDDKRAELVSIAAKQGVPTLAPMNRRKLGRVLQKSVRVSCVGVYSVEGANDLFRQLLQRISR